MAIRIGNLSLAASTGLGLLALCMTFNASAASTPAEIEPFSLTFSERTFHVENDGTPPVVNNTNGPTLLSQLLTFDKFDTSLGTLLGVSISFTSDYASDATLSVIRDVSDPGSVNFFAEGAVGLLLTGPGLITDQQTDQLVGADCSATPETTCSDAGSNNGSFNGSASGSPLASFFGPGTFNLTAELSAALTPRVDPDNGTGFADNSTMDGTLNGSWNGDVSVVYTYDSFTAAVPEPLPLSLLLAALGGFVFSRRRRT